MPDEVADDDSSIAPGDRQRRELTDQWLRDLRRADAAMRAHERSAVPFALAKTLVFVQRLADLEQDLGRMPGSAPDWVLSRVAYAFAGLEEGTVDPILSPAEEQRFTVDAETGERRGVRPGLTLHVLSGRTTAAAAMEILMVAGRKLEAAAQEVATILRDHPLLATIEGKPARAVARWRQDIMAQAEKRQLPDMRGQGVDFRTQEAGRFNYLASEARRLRQIGAPTTLLIWFAHEQLDHGAGMGGNSDLARAKSEHTED